MSMVQESIVPIGEVQLLLRDLTIVWLEFERRLSRVPIIERLERGDLTIEHYQMLLRNLRPQVVEGARWITRAASSFTSEFAELRSKVIGHAFDEHRDYKLIEQDYVSIGGKLDDIVSAPRNIGTEALASYLMQQASLPNPINLLGAMFIIEGLGQKMAQRWAQKIETTLKLGEESTRFLSYHGANDETHIDKMMSIFSGERAVVAAHSEIVKTARVVARLYALQLEEIDNV
jgi:3-oxoacyl-[acyl-carrier-protein] synthase III